MAKRTCLPTSVNGLVPPAELFARPGARTSPSTPGYCWHPDERFRERVAIACGVSKAVRCYEHDHDRLREVLAGMIMKEFRNENK
jgi:hypothetical protein